MAGEGDKREMDDGGIAPGLEDFEKQLEDQEVNLNEDPPDPESMVEDQEPESDQGKPAEDDQPAGDDEPAAGDEPAETLDLEDGDPGSPDGEPTPQEASETSFKIPDHEFYGEHRGKSMSAAQLEEAGLLDKILTGAHQVSHFQKLHEESKGQLETLNERLSKLETPDEAEPELTPEQFRSQVHDGFKPTVDGLATDGLIEDDYAVTYPKKAALDEFRVKVFMDAMTGMDERLAKIEGRVEPWSERDQEHQAVSNVTKIVTELVTEDEDLMGGLKDEATQTDFFAYLSDQERSGVRFTPYDATKKDLRGAWVSYLLDSGSEIPTGKKAEEPAPKQGQKGMTGTGGKARGRGGQAPAPAKDEFQELEDQYNESLGSRFD